MFYILIIKIISMYFLIIIIHRLFEKRNLSDLKIYEFLLLILINTLMFNVLIVDDIIDTLICIFVLLLLYTFLNYLILKNYNFRKVLDGKPIVIIKNGKFDFTEMSKLKYSLDDILRELRLKGIKNIENVKYAILEKNGSMSIFSDNSDYPLPLILDGIIDNEALREIKKDYKWIISILKNKNIELNDVYYAFYVEGKTFVIRKSNLSK